MHFPDLLETLLKERGILAEEREFFLNPDYSHLFDPLLLPDMEKARDRVIKAMKEGESITVFSDYDADGIPGAVVLADFFRRASYENVSFYIPHRHDEGFGLNKEFIEECKAKLLITVDCGMADIAEIKLAKEKGIDVIVTDHHESKELPEAFAIINPKRAGSKYPFKELCGSALAFKLVQAILAKNSFVDVFPTLPVIPITIRFLIFSIFLFACEYKLNSIILFGIALRITLININIGSNLSRAIRVNTSELL